MPAPQRAPAKKNSQLKLETLSQRLDYTLARRHETGVMFGEIKALVEEIEDLLEDLWKCRDIPTKRKKVFADQIHKILGFHAPGDRPRKAFPSRMHESLERQMAALWSGKQLG